MLFSQREGVAHQLGQHLRQRGVPEHTALAHAARAQGKTWACGRVLDRLFKQAAQHGIVYGIPWGGDADTWKRTNGKLYIFGE